MKNHKILLWAFTVLAGLALFSCSDKKSKVRVSYSVDKPSVYYDPESKPDSLAIEFDGSVSPIDMVGKNVETPIEISPAIEGSWLWESDSELRFSPVERWKLGTTYKVKVPSEVFSFMEQGQPRSLSRERHNSRSAAHFFCQSEIGGL